jgi:hypothetical protein
MSATQQPGAAQMLWRPKSVKDTRRAESSSSMRCAAGWAVDAEAAQTPLGALDCREYWATEDYCRECPQKTIVESAHESCAKRRLDGFGSAPAPVARLRVGREGGRARAVGASSEILLTKIAQGGPRLRANFRAVGL